jgi:Domain of unknown function (DUF6268)
MDRWRMGHVLLASAILFPTGLTVEAQDQFGDVRPSVRESLPTWAAEPQFEFDFVPLPNDSSPIAELPASGPVADGAMAPFGEERVPFMSRLSGMPVQNLRSQPGDWSQSGEQIKLAAPIYIAPDGGNLWLTTGTVDHISIHSGARLPDSQRPVPDDLWNIDGGVMNVRDLDNGWKTVAILTVGSASDKPFASLRDMTVTAIGSLEVPYRERDAWSFSVFYSPTSQLPFPLPGVAYVWRPSDRLKANLGIPFSLQYQPTENFSLFASYFPLTNANILARQKMSDRWSLYAGYQVVNETYWLADRTERNELFFLFDQRLTLGLQRKLFGGVSIDLSVGYAFDRGVFQAVGFSDNRRDEITIDSGAFGAVQLSWSL